MSGDRHPELPLDPDAPPLHLRPFAVLLVLVGGAAGTSLRYGLSLLAPSDPGVWPWGTFVANLLGCAILGFLLESLGRAGPDVGRRQQARLLGGVGFCGGLTTYSTFAVEADLLVRADATALALAYLAVSLVAGCTASWAGIALAARRDGAR